jgi:hypothetical protein
MTPPDPTLRQALDDIANALQSPLLLAGNLAMALRSDAQDASNLYEAIARASEAPRQTRSGGRQS